MCALPILSTRTQALHHDYTSSGVGSKALRRVGTRLAWWRKEHPCSPGIMNQYMRVPCSLSGPSGQLPLTSLTEHRASVLCSGPGREPCHRPPWLCSACPCLKMKEAVGIAASRTFHLAPSQHQLLFSFIIWELTGPTHQTSGLKEERLGLCPRWLQTRWFILGTFEPSTIFCLQADFRISAPSQGHCRIRLCPWQEPVLGFIYNVTWPPRENEH